MELATTTEIRDFKVRGNYFNGRTLRFRTERSSQAAKQVPVGYSPPVVDFELSSGGSSSIDVSEFDVPLLSDDDPERAKHYLSLIIQARQGRAEAIQELAAESQRRSVTQQQPQSFESAYVVPCTSHEAHSEQAISQKASILLKLCQLGYPVPEFVVLTSQSYIERNQHLEERLADALRQLEILTTQSLGDPDRPLVFAIRCATSHYIPGVMDTYLNVGVTERTLPALEKVYGREAAHKMYLNNLRNLCRFLDNERYRTLLNGVRHDLTVSEVDRLLRQLSVVLAKSNPSLVEDPFAQAEFLVKQAYKHFEDNRDLVLTLCRGTEHYPSMILQKMICTVRHKNAYAGVISSRNSQTGVGIELQTAHNIFGEEMMTGSAEVETTVFSDPEEIKQSFPAVYHFVPHLPELELQFESPVMIEFAVEATPNSQWFALLQLNETGMAGRAAFTAVIDMHKSGIISRKRVTELIRPYHIKQLTSDTIDREVFETLNPFCTGISVLPRSATCARVYFSGEAALRAKSLGEKVCLCKKTFVPTDTVVMREVDAIISLTSAAIHVVTICQSLGIPALLSLEQDRVTLHPDGRLTNSSGMELREGDWITLSSKRRTLYEGKAKFVTGRFLRYIKGEPVQLDEDEKRSFPSIAYAYRYYQQIMKGLEVDQVSSLNEVTRLCSMLITRCASM